MNSLFKVVLVVSVGIVISTIVYFLSVDRLFPKTEYRNNIEFDLAYLNTNEVLLVAFKEDSASEYELNTFNIPSSRVLHSVSLQVPFEYSPTFALMFGDSNPVTFAIANVKVNGFLVEPSMVKKECELIGYDSQVKDGVVYAQPGTNFRASFLELYHISDKFVNIDRTELGRLKQEDQNLRYLYYISILLIVLFVLSKVKVVLSLIFPLNLKTIVIFAILFHIILITLAIALPFFELYSLSLYNSVVFVKNHLFICLLPSFVFLICSNNKLPLFFRWSAHLITLFILVLIFIDHFVQVIFNSRFIYDTFAKFAGSIIDGIPFFISYITSYSGCYLFLSYLIIIAIIVFIRKFETPNRIRLYCLIILLFSFALNFIANHDFDSKFYNTLQVNISGFYTEGNFKREYVRFKPYSLDNLEYRQYKGLNQRKNVIVVLVESLACDMTFLCGNDNNYSPYTQKLAADNVWFPNYFTNNFHTNGAIFSVTTGLPLVNGPHGEETFFNKEMYKYDLINNFRAAGYTTAYYTADRLILNTKQQLDMSNYSYVSTSNDAYYQKYEKNGVFSSVSDEKLFDKVVNDLFRDSTPKFFLLTTVSTHTPYNTPWGTRDIKSAYAYSDYALKKFIEQLHRINYFDSGILIVTGDHRGWGNNSQKHNELAISIENARMPFILINGVDHGVVRDDVSFSHTSLGVMLEYFMLPSFYKNKYQINPMNDDKKNELIIHYDAKNANNVVVKYGKKVDTVLLDGDQTRFLENGIFEEVEKYSVLGFLSWLRQ